VFYEHSISPAHFFPCFDFILTKNEDFYGGKYYFAQRGINRFSVEAKLARQSIVQKQFFGAPNF
jgi:hypothetical protein